MTYNEFIEFVFDEYEKSQVKIIRPGVFISNIKYFSDAKELVIYFYNDDDMGVEFECHIFNDTPYIQTSHSIILSLNYVECLINYISDVYEVWRTVEGVE